MAQTRPTSSPDSSRRNPDGRKRASRKAIRKKVITTVNLEPDVRAFLDVLMTRYDRDRSYIVNALVKRLMTGDGTGGPDTPRDAGGQPICPPALLG
ncbi:MAG: hypothetical protein AAGK78_04985 [Planctomycetota bacterium]